MFCRATFSVFLPTVHDRDLCMLCIVLLLIPLWFGEQCLFWEQEWNVPSLFMVREQRWERLLMEGWLMLRRGRGSRKTPILFSAFYRNPRRRRSQGGRFTLFFRRFIHSHSISVCKRRQKVGLLGAHTTHFGELHHCFVSDL
jgi:hypothetical protein